MKRWIIGLAWLLMLAVPASAEVVDFAHDVLPILQTHCVKCHTNGRYEGAVSFDTREALIESGVAEPGVSESSTLIERVTDEDPEVRMPPKGPPLTPAQVDVLRRWIDADLSWQQGFSFRKDNYEPPLRPRRPDLPSAEPALTNPIDRIVFAYWKEHGIAAPEALADAAFYRRASLDLVGLLPSIEKVAAFERTPSPQKRAHLVEQLLDNRVAYADHWLTFWNDLLRNDYSGPGYINGGRKEITSWLYRALLDNMPYDRFVRKLVNPDVESEGFANGFVWRGQVNASQRPELQFAQNVGQVFLGVNLKCASCHDSFIDHWKLTDSYGLAAIYSREPLEIHRCDVPTGKTAEPYFLFSELGKVDPQAARDDRLEALATLMTASENGRLTRTVVNRLWDRLMGRGIVFPVDSLGSRPWSEDLIDYLAADLADHHYDLKRTLELIATSQVYGLQCVSWDPSEPVDEFVFRGPAPKRLTAEQFVDSIWQMTGAAPNNTARDDVFGEMPMYAIGGNVGRPFVRSSLVDSTLLMRSLGRPNREQVVTSRPSEMTTLEAIEMSNGQPLAELLHQGSEQLLATHRNWSSEQFCDFIFSTAIGRKPSGEERDRLTKLLGESPSKRGIEDVLWCIVMLPEFQLVR